MSRYRIDKFDEYAYTGSYITGKSSPEWTEVYRCDTIAECEAYIATQPEWKRWLYKIVCLNEEPTPVVQSSGGRREFL